MHFGDVLPTQTEKVTVGLMSLAMRHRLWGIFAYQLLGLRKGNEHFAYTTTGVWHPLFFTVYKSEVSK